MKRFVIATMVVFFIIHFAAAIAEEEGGGSEKTYLVKVTDRDGAVKYESLSGPDWQQLQKQLKLEASLHQKALSAAEAQWRTDEDTKRKAFPKTAISLRKAVVVREFSDAAKASDAQSDLEVREAEKAKAEADRTAKREKDQIDKKTKTKEQIEERKRKDGEREAFLNSARNVYETKLEDIIAQAAGKGEDGAAPAAPEKEQAEKPAKGK